MNIKYMIFDFDGTLADSSQGVIASIVYALESYGYQVPDDDILRKFFGPPLVDSFMQYIGVDEYFQFNKSDASGFYILNGFVSFSRPDLFEKNNRVEKVSISGLSSQKTVDVVLIDTAKPQYINLSEFKDDEIIRITIKSVYNGSKYNDTCVSGIMLVKF